MIIKTKIEKLDFFGRGIAYLDKQVIFIENALPNEIIEIEITQNKKKYLEGKVINYISKSKNRITPECPYYQTCGGCNLSHIKDLDQLKYKKEELINIIKNNCNLNINPVVIESAKSKNYRNKVSLKINNYKWGYYESKSHKFTAINNCLIAKESINQIINKQNFFNIENGEVIIRSNYNDEILINIFSESKVEIDFISLSKDSKILGIILNNKILYGKDSFIEQINNYLFKVSINSFFQINLDIVKEIFKRLSKKSYHNIVDLYCGVGVLGTLIKKDKLYGIDALINAKMNKQFNNFYLLGDSSKISEIKEDIDMLIVDPPRNGINKKTMKHILKSEIKEIIYMSCNPHTLARDLNILKTKYNIAKTYLYNMFPQTYHVETVFILTLID